jgi:hypothetical protein
MSLLQGEEVRSMPWRLLGLMACAAVAGASLASPVPVTDAGDTGPLRRAQGVHLATFALLGGLMTGLAGLAVGPDGWLADARAFAFWYGTSLLCGALVGPGLSWVLPAATLVPVVVFDGSLDDPQPWNWALADPLEPVSYVLPIAALCAGTLAWRAATARRSVEPWLLVPTRR